MDYSWSILTYLLFNPFELEYTIPSWFCLFFALLCSPSTWFLLLTPDTDFWHWSFFFDSFFRYCFFWFLGLDGSFIELRLQWFFLQWFFLWVSFWLLLWVSSFVIFWYCDSWYCSFPILCFLPLCFFYSGFFFLFWFSSYSDFLLIRLSLYVTFLWLINDVDFLLLISFLCGFLVLSSLIDSLCEFLCLIPLIWFLCMWSFLLWFFFLWSSLSDSTDWPSFFGLCEFFESLFLKLLKNSIENF